MRVSRSSIVDPAILALPCCCQASRRCGSMGGEGNANKDSNKVQALQTRPVVYVFPFSIKHGFQPATQAKRSRGHRNCKWRTGIAAARARENLPRTWYILGMSEMFRGLARVKLIGAPQHATLECRSD
jgi:hypothetical protein